MIVDPFDEPCLCDTGFTCLARHVDDAMRELCRHCGQPPEIDGDDSCPCPHTDRECPDHTGGLATCHVCCGSGVVEDFDGDVPCVRCDGLGYLK